MNQEKNFKLDVSKIREDFPILKQKVHGQPLIYFDNAATTQKPKSVIETVCRLYQECNSNVHRGVHCLSGQMTEAYESARTKIKEYLNASSEKEIIFTNGATAAINLAAFSFGQAYIKEGDEIIVSEMEHHSNLVPWQMVCQRQKAKLKVIPFSDDGQLLLDEYRQLITDRTRLVAVVHVSNSLGTINPVKEIIEIAHQKNIPVLVDGAQAVSHIKIDVQDLDCDFYAFSGHKMYGPTGTGVLYAKERWLSDMPPYQSGGDMIEQVSLQQSTYNELPFKFEAGTPNYIGFAGLGEAVDYLVGLGLDNIGAYERELMLHGTKKLLSIPGLKIYGTASDKICNLSFSLDSIPAYDLGMLLDKMGIAVRTGHHCTQPIWQHYGIEGSVRASLSFYNTFDEIDSFCLALEKIKKMFA
jgi:cysteine desulfurase / selenocysteine lyase